jgi:hypothetical protein
MSDLLEWLTDTDHCLVVARRRERLSVSKRATQILICRDLSSRTKTIQWLRNSIRSESRKGLQNLDYNVDISRAWKNIRENIKMSAERESRSLRDKVAYTMVDK